MTNLEKRALLTLAERLKVLASLERARFCSNTDEDNSIKKEIKPYMMWFEGVALDIETIVDLTDKSGYFKKSELEEIIRLNL